MPVFKNCNECKYTNRALKDLPCAACITDKHNKPFYEKYLLSEVNKCNNCLHLNKPLWSDPCKACLECYRDDQHHLFFTPQTQITYVNDKAAGSITLPAPMIRPKLNFSDMILVKNALEIIKARLLPELQERCDLIIAELLRAEKARKEEVE